MASCSIDGKSKSIPVSILTKGISEWKSQLTSGKPSNEAISLAYIKHLKDTMGFVEWVSFLQDNALVTPEQASRTKQLNEIADKQLNEVAEDLGVEFEKGDTIPTKRSKVKKANKKINNDPGRFESAKKAMDDILSVASEGSADELGLEIGRAKILGRDKKKVWQHASADISLLIDLIIPTRVNGEGYKEGVYLKKIITEAIITPWEDAHRASVKKGSSVASEIVKISKETGVKGNKLVNIKTDVPISGVSNKFYTEDQAVQAYLFDSSGQSIGSIPEGDLKALIDYVESKPSTLKKYADGVFEATNGWIDITDSWGGFTINGAIERYYKQDYKKKLLEEYGWTQARKEIFNDDTYNKIIAAYSNGEGVVKSLKSVLDGMATGETYENEGGKDVARVLAAFNALPIGGNIYIGVKQLSSFLNFVEVSGPNNLAAFSAAFLDANYLKVAKAIFNSEQGVERLGSGAYDIDFGILLEGGKVSNSGIKNFAMELRRQAIDLAYKPVSYGDIGAIVIGGAAYIINYQKKFMEEGLTEDEAFDKAMNQMWANAETTQQSKLPTKVSAQQRRLSGKILLPFKTFQQQAIRKAREEYRHVKRLGKDATLEDKKKALGNILYYRVASPAIFSLLSNAVFAGMFDDDDENKEKWAKDTLNSIIEFNLVGYGVHGAITAIAYRLLNDIYDQLEAEKLNSGKLIKTLLGLSPAVSVGTRQLDRIGWAARGKNPDKIEIAVLGVETVTQVPLYNLYNYVNNYNYLLKRELDAVDQASLILGIKPHTLGIKPLK